MTIKSLHLKTLAIAGAFLFSSITASADPTGKTTSPPPTSNDSTLARDVILGVGVAAAIGTGAYFGLRHHGSDGTSAGPLCDATCDGKIRNAVRSYMQDPEHKTYVMQVSFKTATQDYNLEVSQDNAGNFKESNALQSSLYAGLINQLFTTKIILDLKAQNKIELDAPISNYPGVQQYPAWGQKTIRNLLTMTSNIDNYLLNLPFIAAVYANPTAFRSVDELLAVTYPDLNSQPWNLSATNAILLEKIIGTTYEGQVNSLIAAQKLANTKYTVTASALPANMAKGYIWDAGRQIETTSVDPSVYRAAGALVSTAADISQLMRSIFTSSSQGLFTKDQLNEINNSMVCTKEPSRIIAKCQAGELLPPNSTEIGYFGGVYRFGLNKINEDFKPDLLYEADGLTYGHKMTTIYYPAKDATITIAGNSVTVNSQSQLNNYNDLLLQIAKILYGDQFGK